MRNEENYFVFQLIHSDGKVNSLFIQWLYFSFCIIGLATFVLHTTRNKKHKRKMLLQRNRCDSDCSKRGNTPVDKTWGVCCAC